MRQQPGAEIRRDDFNIVVTENNDIAAGFGKTAIVAFTQRASVADLHHLESVALKQRFKVLANALGLLRIDAADHDRDQSVVLHLWCRDSAAKRLRLFR